MKRLRPILLIAIPPLLCLVLLYEVVNPHSFVSYKGAFLRAAALIAAAGFWVRLSWKKRDRVFLAGLGIITVASLLYWNYGLWELCANNLDLMTSSEIPEGAAYYGECMTVFSRMISGGAPATN
ncbi:MAG: hypothetical protein IMF05_08740 [Proteobacteria bacterium]|nr:hypothetical protein [Pseudomonadota bacterium]